MASKCPNCGAAMSDTELREGWCDSCGKRLPGGSGWSGAADSGSPARAKPGKPTTAGYLIVFGCIAVGATIATLGWKNSSLATGLGCGIGAGLGALLARAAGHWPRPA